MNLTKERDTWLDAKKKEGDDSYDSFAYCFGEGMRAGMIDLAHQIQKIYPEAEVALVMFS